MVESSDVSFFEWASEILVEATKMPKTKPIVTRMHSYEVFAWAPLVNWDNVDRIVLVSNAMQKTFCDIYPKQAAKTCVVYNGCDLGSFTPQPTKPFEGKIGMLCSINPRKRVYEIIIMMKQLLEMGHDAELHIAGGKIHAPDMDEYFEAVHRIVKKLGLEGSVHFSGQVTTTAEWLKDIDVFVSNSYWEGQQVALLEAMASGCTSYSHFWDGAEEMLPEDHVYYSENQLLERLVAYWKLSDGDREAIRRNMRAIAEEKFDIENTKLGIRNAISGFVDR